MITFEVSPESGILSYDCKVPAGFPSPSMDYMQECIDLNKEFVPHPLSTFIIESTGYSMINAFIPPRLGSSLTVPLRPKTATLF